jgi:cell wall-associated NlpC family hydrolase
VKRAAFGSCAFLLLLPVLFISAAMGALGSGGADVNLGGASGPVSGIPTEYLQLFQSAGARYGVPWAVLAGIGKVECDDGQDPDPSCTHEGATNYAGAGGPMQFLGSTWAEYAVDGDGDGRADRWDAADAIFTAARYLKASGAPGELERAIFAYNHSTAYVRDVLHWAATYEAESPSVEAAPGGAAETALGFALKQLGVPYVWGGESVHGFDCSGLAQLAYHVAGVSLPRTAQEQFDAGPRVPAGTPLAPGDLVFFGGGENDVTHVGIVIHSGQMVDAPHSGADVRTESFPTTPRASWGDDLYLGATRPAAR